MKLITLRTNFIRKCVLCSRTVHRTVQVRTFSDGSENSTNSTKVRKNELNIQMINDDLRTRIFGAKSQIVSSSSTSLRSNLDIVNQRMNYATNPGTNLCTVKEHLSKHGFWSLKANRPVYEPKYDQEIMIDLPQLLGPNINDHFRSIGDRYSKDYRDLLENFVQLCSSNQLPERPIEWSYRPGWTRYTKNADGSFRMEQVPFPQERLLVFDVEVCMQDGNFPTLATVLAPNAWYSWCSDRLVNGSGQDRSMIDQLVPMGYSDEPRIVIGHNVAFDRSFIREQYELRNDAMRFMDTMSLHICISGLTGYQRALSYSYNSAKRRGISEGIINQAFKERHQPNPINWEGFGAVNNLLDVHKFYCSNDEEFTPLEKDIRDVFVKGTLDDVRTDFPNLMNYCASDVEATKSILTRQWPQFTERFPHPVTLAGMLEMSIMYLPTREKTWNCYINTAQDVYEKLERQVTRNLINIANKECQLINDDAYKRDPWLWDLDWSVQDLRYRKNTKAISSKIESESKKSQISSQTSNFVKQIIKNEKSLNKVQPFLPGYPAWYRDLCVNPYGSSRSPDRTADPNWRGPGPTQISIQMRSVPKLLRLMFDNFALHYDNKHGWGILVPKLNPIQQIDENSVTIKFPYEEYIKIVKPIEFKEDEQDLLFNQLDQTDVIAFDNFEEIRSVNYHDLVDYRKGHKEQKTETNSMPSSMLSSLINEDNYCPDVDVFGCRFYKLPHKDGPENNVGNPLGKDFLRYVEEGRLSCYGSDLAHELLCVGKTTSYWKMTGKRIKSQLMVPISSESDEAAILPRAIVAGTVTRRAVEPCWLTASNAQKDRLGSELKSLILAPRGYKFVGADVDSQELWIASLLGDAHFAKIHGCTGIGWMTLQGTKADGTDMHSKTASLVDIDRNQAKILNYGRIYGAGKAFAARFLKQSNVSLNEREARKKAHDIYKQTKGVRYQSLWTGGTESHMFNKLEQVARALHPETPVLNARISRALEVETVRDEFVTSLINWVVQSSAVDYLHLMLVCMKWLMEEYKIDGRFSISIHDEVRYIVKEEDLYRSALALQISNLLTRSIFCYKLGMNDLPQSIAFFSSVDIDNVLRKEPNDDCVTPSCPEGLSKTYGIEKGESLTIKELLDRIGS